MLYVNHTAEMSGGERSLIYLLNALPSTITPTVACPQGPLALAVRQLRIPAVTIPAIDGSLRLHLRHTPQSILALVRAAFAIRRLAQAEAIDLVHANSIRAGLAAAMAAWLGGPPTISHVRDCLPVTALTNLVHRFLGKHAATIIANSHYTAANFDRKGCRAAVTVIHNAIDLNRFDPMRIGRDEARDKLGLNRSAMVLGVVAQITPWKGQIDAIRAVALLRRKRQAELLLVGEAKFRGGRARYDTYAYRDLLTRTAQELGLGEAVHFLGQRSDVPEIMRALDLLLVPSWEEPFGNVALEAMAMETPVIASDVGGLAEIVRAGKDGLLLPPKQPELWAQAINELLAQPELRAAMGRNGRRRVETEFDEARHLNQVLAVYRTTLDKLELTGELQRAPRLDS